MAACRTSTRRRARTSSGFSRHAATSDLPGGVLHGDYELDNLRARDSGFVAFDVDEASIGPYVIDIAAAVRDLLGDGAAMHDPAHPQLLAAFLAGYAEHRVLSESEASALAFGPAFIAARSRRRLHGVFDAGGDADAPEWLVDLRAQIAQLSDAARQVMLDTAAAAP